MLRDIARSRPSHGYRLDLSFLPVSWPDESRWAHCYRLRLQAAYQRQVAHQLSALLMRRSQLGSSKRCLERAGDGMLLPPAMMQPDVQHVLQEGVVSCMTWLARTNQTGRLQQLIDKLRLARSTPLLMMLRLTRYENGLDADVGCLADLPNMARHLIKEHLGKHRRVPQKVMPVSREFEYQWD